MPEKLKSGLCGFAETIVDNTNTALTMGSGSLEVFATPAMIALMEKAACNTVNAYLGEELSTVGIRIDVAHTAATPIGKKVTAKAELLDVDDRSLTFVITALCGDEIIGKGTHERFIINKEKFMRKLTK